MKLVILGGGSLNTPAFFAALSADDKWLDGACLVDVSAESVERVGQFCVAICRQRGLPTKVTWDTDLAGAARGADIVLNMLRVGGLPALEEDLRRLAVSGVVGHAASYSQAIRNLPDTLGAARVVEQVAPESLWVNFANPVTLLCEALALETHLNVLGICYHVFAMPDDFAEMLGVESSRMQVEFFGLNHIGWVTDVRVDGQSEMARLVQSIRERRNKKYNYWYARERMIPIDHAFCLYHKGEVWLNRQKGIRGSLADVGVRLGLISVAKSEQQRETLRQAVSAQNVMVLDPFHSQAPWYRTCILPFLRAVASGQPHEFVLTWRHKGQVPTLPDVTGESRVEVQGCTVRSASRAEGLEDFAAEWIRQIRASETLMIHAILEHSRQKAAMAWAVHPSVASAKHAERLARFYFE